jgi:hypothetical protein
MGHVTGLLGNLAAGALLVAAVLLLLLAAAAIHERAGNTMAILGKDQIFSADDIKTEIVEVPEWGGQVMVRGLTGHQRDEWEKGLMVRKGRQYVQDMTDFRARLAVLCVVDEKNERLFHDGDAAQLAGKSGAALDRVYSKAAELSGISEKDVEDLTKDFGTEPDGGGSSTT